MMLSIQCLRKSTSSLNSSKRFQFPPISAQYLLIALSILFASGVRVSQLQNLPRFRVYLDFSNGLFSAKIFSENTYCSILLVSEKKINIDLTHYWIFNYTHILYVSRIFTSHFYLINAKVSMLVIYLDRPKLLN